MNSHEKIRHLTCAAATCAGCEALRQEGLRGRMQELNIASMVATPAPRQAERNQHVMSFLQIEQTLSHPRNDHHAILLTVF